MVELKWVPVRYRPDGGCDLELHYRTLQIDFAWPNSLSRSWGPWQPVPLQDDPQAVPQVVGQWPKRFARPESETEQRHGARL